MEVKFDLIRIGRIRKNYAAEIMLQQNLEILKSGIRSLLKDENIKNNNNEISMVIIIPGKGYNIKIALQNIKDEHIRKQLRLNYPNSIYNNDYSTIIDNLNNKIFCGYL